MSCKFHRCQMKARRRENQKKKNQTQKKRQSKITILYRIECVHLTKILNVWHMQIQWTKNDEINETRKSKKELCYCMTRYCIGNAFHVIVYEKHKNYNANQCSMFTSILPSFFSPYSPFFVSFNAQFHSTIEIKLHCSATKTIEMLSLVPNARAK